VFLWAFIYLPNIFRTATGDGKPIMSVDIQIDTDSPISAIPRRRKALQESNGHDQNSALNGNSTGSLVEPGAPSKKRTATEALDDTSPSQKRSKMENGVIAIDDTDNGAILIDDD